MEFHFTIKHESDREVLTLIVDEKACPRELFPRLKERIMRFVERQLNGGLREDESCLTFQK